MGALKFAYLSTENPLNKRVWSGTHYSIYKSLLTLGEVEILGPYQPKLLLFWLKLYNQFCIKILNKRYNYRHSFLLSKVYATYFEKKLQNKNIDFIVAPAASAEVAFIVTNIPIIYITDGTIAGCLNYHKALTNLTRSSIHQSNAIEQKTLEKSSKIIVSSMWCYNSVINDYKINASKIFQFPYGANFEMLPNLNNVNYTFPITFNLLFIGVYWEEKGGPVALNAFTILKQKGYAIHFTIVGCQPNLNNVNDGITVIPFIDKNSNEGQEKLKQIMANQHCLILPTRFDCTPIVINEASAFGIPCLVANTGGVKGHLHENENGFLFDYADDGTGYAKKIEEFIQSPQSFIQLRNSTRKLYDEKLNWNKWALEFKTVLEK